MKRKHLKRMLIMALSAMMLFTMALTAYAADVFAGSNGRCAFYFDLEAYGDKDQSAIETKENSGNALFYFNSCAHSHGYPPVYRLYSGTNDTKASNLYTYPGVTHATPAQVVYNSGYGRVGYGYYIKCQTDTHSSVATIVSGHWIP